MGTGHHWGSNYTSYLSVQVWDIIREVNLDPLLHDRFVWKWTADGSFSTSSAYRAFFATSSSLLGAKELWQMRAPQKTKFFFWLALHQRLWTADRRWRHGLQEVVLFADRSLRLQITSFMVVCLLANYGTCCFIPSACLVAYRDKRTRW